MFISVKINIQTSSQLARLPAVKFLSSQGKSKLYQPLASNKSPKSGCRRCWLGETLQTFICIFQKKAGLHDYSIFTFFLFPLSNKFTLCLRTIANISISLQNNLRWKNRENSKKVWFLWWVFEMLISVMFVSFEYEHVRLNTTTAP